MRFQFWVASLVSSKAWERLVLWWSVIASVQNHVTMYMYTIVIIAPSAIAVLVCILQELASHYKSYMKEVLPLPLWLEQLTSVTTCWYDQGPGQLVLGGIRLTCCCCYIFCH
jgi:hypothetical protein